jgi:hypothetical protein
VIRLGALIIAGLGLAGTIAFTQTRPAERPAAPGVLGGVPPAPPMRDQWYLDQAVATAVPVWSQARDRWYLDGRVATDPPKDRWYSGRP